MRKSLATVSAATAILSLLGACQDVSDPVRFPGLREGAVVESKANLTLTTHGESGGPRTITAAGVVRGRVQGGSVEAKFVIDKQARAGLVRFNQDYSDTSQANCDESCKAELDSIIAQFAATIVTHQEYIGPATWSMTDSAGHQHRVEFVGDQDAPLRGMLATTDGQTVANADYDWRLSDEGWWLKTQVTRAYADGALTMELRVTFDGPQIIESALLSVPKGFLADALSVFLPKKAYAQSADDCQGEAAAYGASIGLLAAAVWKARKERSWKNIGYAYAALLVWYAAGDEFMSCLRGRDLPRYG